MRLFFILALLGIVGSSATAAPPNIVLIVADDLGMYELGCYGQTKIKTPAIDQLARQGMKFQHFYAGNAVCAPSRCCLMTGKHAGHASVRNNREVKPEGQHPIPAEEVTIAERLKTQGYATAAMGKWGLGMFGSAGDPLQQGFDLFYGYNCQRHAHSHYPTFLYRNAERFPLPGNTGKTGNAYTQDLFEREALAFLDQHRERPFFLYLPLIVPHVAIQVPEDSLAEYRGQLGDDPPYTGKKGYIPHPAPRAGYAAMVTRMDRTIGRIMAKLKGLQLDENTLVLFTSDNGPTHNVGGADSTFFQSAGPLRGLKGSLYEGGIRVPLIAVWPGKIAPGSTCDEPYYFPDFLPTFCEIASVKSPTGIDGVSLLPALHSDKNLNKHKALYWEFPGYGGQQAVRAGSWKAVRQNLARGMLKTELYDLAADPGESRDLAAQKPDVLAKMESLFRELHVPNSAFPLQSIDRTGR